MRARVLYEERSNWPFWVHFLIWFCSAACILPVVASFRGTGGAEPMPPWVVVLCVALGVAFPLTFYGLMGQLRTRILDDGILVVWGFVEVIKKKVRFEDIETVEPVTYSPLGEFGGWGIRYGSGKKRAWNIRGNQAVRLELADGIRLYVGSDHPSRLAERIRSGLSMHQGRENS